MTAKTVITDAVAILGAGGLGAAALKLTQWWLEKRAQRPSVSKDAADLVNAAAVFQSHLNAAAEGIVGQLREEIAQMKKDHAREIAELRQKHAACEADSVRIEGELSQQRQITESLARELRRAGIDVTDLTGQRPLIVLQPTLPGTVK